MLSIKYYILLRFSCASQTPKGVIYGNSKIKIYGNLWLIDGHFWLKEKFIYEHFYLIHEHLWPFPARSAKPFLNIYGFIDDHLWPKKARSAKNRRPFMIFFDQKTAKRKTEDHLCFIDDHFWQKTKYKRVGVFVFSYSKTRTSLQKYNFSFIRYNFKGRKFYDSSFFCWIV